MAKTDTLDLIYTSQKPAPPTPMLTRSKSSKQEQQETLSLAESLYEDENNDDHFPTDKIFKRSEQNLQNLSQNEYTNSPLETIAE